MLLIAAHFLLACPTIIYAGEWSVTLGVQRQANVLLGEPVNLIVTIKNETKESKRLILRNPIRRIKYSQDGNTFKSFPRASSGKPPLYLESLDVMAKTLKAGESYSFEIRVLVDVRMYENEYVAVGPLIMSKPGDYWFRWSHVIENNDYSGLVKLTLEAPKGDNASAWELYNNEMMYAFVQMNGKDVYYKGEIQKQFKNEGVLSRANNIINKFPNTVYANVLNNVIAFRKKHQAKMRNRN